jgi:hypothetical protein
MQSVNRGFLIIKPKSLFLNWANQFEDQFQFNEADEVESTSFLIEEDFFEIEPIIQKHFKKIMKNELSMVTEDEENWPEKITLELFLEWFSVEIGSIVLDLEKTDLKRSKI